MTASASAVADQAAFYALLHGGNPGDVELYVERCSSRDGRPLRVLELGCGAGRVLTALAAAGCEVTGVELHPGLAAMARSALAEADLHGVVIEGDMRAFALEGVRFDRVIAPYNALYALLDDDDIVRALCRAREHLADDGLFITDGYVADVFHAEGLYGYPVEREVASVPWAGQELTVFETSVWYEDAERVDVVYRYRDAEGALVHRAELPQHYVLVPRWSALLGEAGLLLEAIEGGFEGEEVDLETSENVVVFARHA